MPSSSKTLVASAAAAAMLLALWWPVAALVAAPPEGKTVAAPDNKSATTAPDAKPATAPAPDDVGPPRPEPKPASAAKSGIPSPAAPAAVPPRVAAPEAKPLEVVTKNGFRFTLPAGWMPETEAQRAAAGRDDTVLGFRTANDEAHFCCVDLLGRMVISDSVKSRHLHELREILSTNDTVDWKYEKTVIIRVAGTDSLVVDYSFRSKSEGGRIIGRAVAVPGRTRALLFNMTADGQDGRPHLAAIDAALVTVSLPPAEARPDPGSLVATATEFKGVQFTMPAGWSREKVSDVAPDAKMEGSQDAVVWFREGTSANLAMVSMGEVMYLDQRGLKPFVKGVENAVTRRSADGKVVSATIGRCGDTDCFDVSSELTVGEIVIRQRIIAFNSDSKHVLFTLTAAKAEFDAAEKELSTMIATVKTRPSVIVMAPLTTPASSPSYSTRDELSRSIGAAVGTVLAMALAGWAVLRLLRKKVAPQPMPLPPGYTPAAWHAAAGAWIPQQPETSSWPSQPTRNPPASWPGPHGAPPVWPHPHGGATPSPAVLPPEASPPGALPTGAQGTPPAGLMPPPGWAGFRAPNAPVPPAGASPFGPQPPPAERPGDRN